MTARILIVDGIATHRIVLKAKLPAATYQTEVCTSVLQASDSLRRARPDLVIVDLSDPGGEMAAFCGWLRASPDHRRIPVLATGVAANMRARLRALALGVDDILDPRMSDTLLTARVRSLLRRRDSAAELRLREDARRALGFAEAQEPFAAPKPRRQGRQRRVTLVTDRAATGRASTGRAGLTRLTPDAVLAGRGADAQADLFILDAASLTGPRGTSLLFRMVAELRAQPETRLAAQLVLLPAGQDDAAAMVLDLGADDIAPSDATAREIVLRARRLMQQKAEQDALRDTVRSGLEAAVTDPLTGLYNRRYVQSHLAGMAERAALNGRGFALMLLDIDHFKTVNDRFGHAAGDAVLREMGQRLRHNLRAVDLVARIGGEEFLVAMPDTGEEQALRTAERLRQLIDHAPFRPGPQMPPLTVTVSVGVVVAGQGCAAPDALDRLIAAADGALYAAKSGGRNMVTLVAWAA